MSPNSGQKPDLSDEVTVFVLTVGEPTLLACLAALRQQTCTFKLEKIENIAPMDRALQAALDRCTTKYYVQVDADMILKPDAIARLYAFIESLPGDTMQALISLYDQHLGRDILGVRIVRHAIAKRYPFRPVQGCETDQFRRADADGHLTVCRIGPNIEVAGIHATVLSPQSAYERYRTLFRRARKDEGIDWVAPYARDFLRRLISSGSEADLFVFLGTVAGILAPLDVEEGEKNATVVSDELMRLYDYFEGVLPNCQKRSE